MIRRVTVFAGLLLVSVVACAGGTAAVDTALVEVPENAKVATFGGGCFCAWSHHSERKVCTLSSVVTRGQRGQPSYNEVAGGRTGHTEVVQVTYDPTQITYEAFRGILAEYGSH